MRIGSLYRPGLRTCSSTDPLRAAAQQMALAEVGALAVVDEHEDGPVGIISERDLVWAFAQEDNPGTVDVSVYTSPTVHTAETDEDSSDVMRRMLDAGIRHLPVIERGQLVGMVSMRDLLAVASRGDRHGGHPPGRP